MQKFSTLLSKSALLLAAVTLPVLFFWPTGSVGEEPKIAKASDDVKKADGKAKSEALVPKPIYSKVAKLITSRMPRHHVNRLDFDDEISGTGLEFFLRSLDYDRSFFLAEDIIYFMDKEDDLDDELKDGEVDFAFEVFNTYLERVENRVKYVETLLDEGFDLEIHEDYTWNRKNAPWLTTDAERDDLWRRKIKNEYVGLLVSQRKEKEAAAEKKAEAEKKKAEAEKNASGNDSEKSSDAKDGDAKDGDAEKDAKPKKTPPTPKERINKKYQQFLTVLKGHDSEWVIQNYFTAFTRAYDTHSTYMAPRAKEDFDIDMKLELTGIGAVLTYEEGAAVIKSIVKGGAAAKNKELKPGDKIIGVGQGDEEIVDTLYWPLYKTVRLIRGKIGTTVVLSVIPADSTGGEIEKISMKRERIKLENRAAKGFTEEVKHETKDKEFKLGVIDLPDFYEDMGGRRLGAAKPRSCATDVKKLLEGFKKDNVDGVLIDLRNNGGGSLRACVEMAGYFITGGPVVQIKDERGVRQYPDPDPRLVYGGPVVVLVNRHSASASEIIAAALQDYGRAVVVGDSQTHGKGTVQTLIQLDPRKVEYGQFKVTTASFFRIDGGSTQLKGVCPDIVIHSPLDYRKVGEKYLDNALEWQQVDRASFRPQGVAGQLVKELTKKSEERRKNSEQFKAYNELIDQLKERYDRKEISLNLEKRIEMAEEDKKLDKLIEKMGKQDRAGDGEEGEEGADKDDANGEKDAAKDDDKAEGGEDAKEKKQDLILDEALLILRDMIDVEKRTRLLRESGA